MVFLLVNKCWSWRQCCFLTHGTITVDDQYSFSLENRFRDAQYIRTNTHPGLVHSAATHDSANAPTRPAHDRRRPLFSPLEKVTKLNRYVEIVLLQIGSSLLFTFKWVIILNIIKQGGKKWGMFVSKGSEGTGILLGGFYSGPLNWSNWIQHAWLCLKSFTLVYSTCSSGRLSVFGCFSTKRGYQKSFVQSKGRNGSDYTVRFCFFFLKCLKWQKNKKKNLSTLQLHVHSIGQERSHECFCDPTF